MTKTDLRADPVTLLKDLIRCPSVTPREAGVLDHLEDVLTPAGFECTRLKFSDTDTPDVDNLFVRIGSGGPHLAFAGHVDVVPPGDEALWTHPPFEAVEHDGIIFGRGACDMKGSVAAFCAAALDFVADQDGNMPGSISMIITGDEEGPAINGTIKMLEWIKDNNHVPDECLVGEPTSAERFGDGIKIGRRGSMSFEVKARGVQGHVAYPHLAKNPIPALARVIDGLSSTPLDNGTNRFDPSTLAATSFDVGNPAGNVSPETATVKFNIRFNTEQTPETLMAIVQKRCDTVTTETGISFDIKGYDSSQCFVTEPGPLVDVMQAALEAETGMQAGLNTSGGTSDARFIKDYCPVIEFGPINATIHQIDERIPVEELRTLTRVYRRVLDGYLTGAER